MEGGESVRLRHQFSLLTRASAQPPVPPALVDEPREIVGQRTQYDNNWLRLVQHYFLLLQWRPATDKDWPISLVRTPL